MKKSILVASSALILGLVSFVSATGVSSTGDVSVKDTEVKTDITATSKIEANGEVRTKIEPTVLSAPKAKESDSSEGKELQKGEDSGANGSLKMKNDEGKEVEKVEASESIGDPDFDLLTFSLKGDEGDGNKIRSEIKMDGTVKKVGVRGWDAERKEEIIGHPEGVKSSDDLKMYVEAMTLRDDAIVGVNIDKGAIDVESSEEGKLFWVIPVKIPSHVVVALNGKEGVGETVSVKLPWWNIFVKKGFGGDDLKTEISAGISSESKASLGASHISSILGQISNVLKTKHDTVKASVNVQ